MDMVKEFFKYFSIISSNVVCAVALIYILSWNANNVGYTSLGPPREVRWIGWAFHLDQSWA